MNLNATIFGQIIAFILFVLFCMKYVWVPLMAVIEKRQKEIADDLASAAHVKKELDIAYAEVSERLKQAKEEAQIIIEQANKYGEQLIGKAEEKAKVERNKILAKAQVEINMARNRASEELRKQVAILALACAEKIIDGYINKAISSDIVDKIIAEI